MLNAIPLVESLVLITWHLQRLLLNDPPCWYPDTNGSFENRTIDDVIQNPNNGTIPAFPMNLIENECSNDTDVEEEYHVEFYGAVALFLFSQFQESSRFFMLLGVPIKPVRGVPLRPLNGLFIRFCTRLSAGFMLNLLEHCEWKFWKFSMIQKIIIKIISKIPDNFKLCKMLIKFFILLRFNI